MIDTVHTNPSKIPSWMYDKIERKVVDLYIEQSITEIPINPFEIIKNRGYVLVPFSKLQNTLLSGKDSDKHDALSFFSPELQRYVIAYNDEKPLPRLRFTLMHEIAHIDLEHRCESDLARRMADYYAGYALAPSPLIGLFTSGSKTEIQSKFSVSKECAEVSQNRYYKWSVYGGSNYKDYEITLLNLFN